MPFSIVCSALGEHLGKETTYHSAPALSYMPHLCDMEMSMIKKKLCILLMSEIKMGGGVIFQILFVSRLDVKELTFIYTILGSIL